MIDHVAELDERILMRYAADARPDHLPLVFILGSPRTGSTLVYQLMINAFGLFYVSNLINDLFGEHPAVGTVLDQQLNPREPVPYASRYGKTSSPFGPSEASRVLRHWYGGAHPSQTESSRILPARRDHMIRSMAAMHAMARQPIVIKNAWNCFRVPELARMFPRSVFIWVRRDIEAAAISDLESRYAHGSPERWNSATTANYLELQQRPYWEQVVEQQFEYNRAIAASLSAIDSDRSLGLWYEEVCNDPADAIERCERWLRAAGINERRQATALPQLSASGGRRISEEDRERLRAYVRQHADDRLRSFRRAAPSACTPRS